nr:hypothetical protein [Tanacetum cinerariifolium]
MMEAIREAVQIQTDRLQDSFQRENDEFLRTIDENMKKIIKEQVKSQVKEQVSRILPRIEESVNATLETEVLTRSSHSSLTLYAVAADLTEIDLKKILIEKMEGNKSIQRSDEQHNLYKALVDAYEADKTILKSYDQGSKRQREGREHASASTPSEQATGSTGMSATGTQSRQLFASESAFIEEPVQTTCQMEEPSHLVFETGAKDQPIVQTSQHPEWFYQPRRPPTPDCDWNKTLPAAQGNAQSWISELARQTDARSSFNELLDTPIDFSNFIMNRLNVETLTPELLAGPTFELMRGSLPDNWGRRVIPFAHFINNDLEYLRGDLVPRTMWIQEPLNYDKYALWGVSHWGENVSSSTGKLSNLTVEEHFAFNVSLRMFTKSIVIQRRVEDLQLGVESYQKRLNLTKLDTYRSDLKQREAYTAYSNRRGFIYQNKDKKNRLMRIDKHHKFSDGTLNDVRSALDDRRKGIQMQYLPTTIWRRGDKDRAAAMIQAFDKMLKTRRIMRSLEKFVGRRLTLSKTATEGAGRSTTGSQSRQMSATAQGDAQSWISDLERQTDARSSFNELLDTPIDFSNFIMHWLNVDTLTPDLLAGPTYELMRGSCTSLTELEYHLEEVYKATTDKLDWVNPEGQQYPHNLLQPLPLIPDNRGRRVISFEHFINNDLEYLWGGASSHYNRHALWGVSHWGRKRKQFYGYAVNRESALDVYSMYTPRGGSSLSLSSRLWNGTTTSIWIGFQSIVIKRRVEDLQLGVEIYQKRLNLTKPDTYRPDLRRREAYMAHSNPRGFIYQNKDKKNRLMRIDELHKFSDGTLNDVRNALDDRLKGIRIE